jgi:large subunit ribosomal protein L28
VCHKGTQWGRNIRHKASIGWALRAPKTNRAFRPNVQRHTIQVNGETRRAYVCTRCLRTMQKVG